MEWFAGIETESVSDSGSSNVVLAVTLLLVVAGIALTVVTVWFWRNTRPDPEALGPLLVMSERKFFEVGPIEQRRRLDRARPGDVSVPDDVSVSNDDGDRPVPLAEDLDDHDDWFDDHDDWDDLDHAVQESAETHEPPIDESPSAAPIDPLLGR